MPSEASDVILRCRKCRQALFTSNGQNEIVAACCKTFAQLQPMMENDGDDSRLPEWLQSILNQNEWRKGKLCCPECNGKVGSFNFVTPQKCQCGRRQTPPIYLYKSRVDVCVPINPVARNEREDVRDRCDHIAVLKRSAIDGEEWTVIFESKQAIGMSSTPTPPSSKPASYKTHRKSQSWHASGSAVSNWFSSTFSNASSHLDVAATETKQALVGTLDLASNVAAPVSTAIRKGHRKTQSWGGSIKTTISSLLGGIFSNGREPLNGGSISPPPSPQPLTEESDDAAVECNLDEPLDAGTDETTDFEHAENGATAVSSRRRKRTQVRASRGKKPISKPNRTRSRSPSMSSVVPDYLLCSICLDIFCLPRYCLPCKHTFCEPCLKLLVRNSPLPRKRLRTLCPLCRQLIRWTEPAIDLHETLRESNYANRYSKRVLEYRIQPSLHMLKLPGIYHLKCVRQVVNGLPEGLASYLETFWVNYTPLVTLYSFCVSLLCLLFFFTLFLPCVYLTSWICKFFENFSSFNELGAPVIYQEVLDFSALVISNGMLSLASIVVIISIALYTLFVM